MPSHCVPSSLQKSTNKPGSSPAEQQRGCGALLCPPCARVVLVAREAGFPWHQKPPGPLSVRFVKRRVCECRGTRQEISSRCFFIACPEHTGDVSGTGRSPTVIGGSLVLGEGFEVVYEMMLTLWKERQVPSLTLTQHKSRVTVAKSHYEIGEIESRFQPSLAPLKQCCV